MSGQGLCSHPGLPEMVAGAKAAGCQVALLTNGTLLNVRLAEEFIKAGLDELRISLWAANEEQYRVLNPGTRPEMFHRALEGVRSMAAAKREARPTALDSRAPAHRPPVLPPDWRDPWI